MNPPSRPNRRLFTRLATACLCSLAGVQCGGAQDDNTQDDNTQDNSDLPEHTIPQAAGPLTIDGILDEPSWQAAPAVRGFLFPWWEAGAKEPTEARLLWDNENLYVAFVAHDRHISATLTQRDDPVSRDDAVEVFIAPRPEDVSIYFNFEFNALGTILDRSPRDNRSSDWDADGIVVAITIDGTLNDDTDEDRQWTTEIAIPFDSFAPFADPLPPAPGDTWRLNLYRIERRAGRQTRARIVELGHQLRQLEQEHAAADSATLAAVTEPLRATMRQLGQDYRDQTEFTAWSETFRRGFHHPARFGQVQFLE